MLVLLQCDITHDLIIILSYTYITDADCHYPRSPLKVFIVVSVVCVFSTACAGSGLYKAVSEDKFSSLKNTQTYEIIHSEDDVSTLDEEKTFPLQKIDDEDRSEDTSAQASSWLRDLFPNTATLFLCAVGFLASYGEGGMVTWSVIYYERYMHVSDTFNSLGYVTFMICMAAGRFACDSLR